MSASLEQQEKVKTRALFLALDVAGRIMVATGVMMLLFVAYQLWGTGFAESKSQATLETEFKVLTEIPTTTPTLPSYGGVVARIEIPVIDVDKFVVAGVDAKSLQKGPGLFPGSPLAGQLGNVAITGHRTTYGAPFGRIDEVSIGDEITVQTAEGTFTYIVNAAPFVVEPTQTDVARTLDPNRAMLTLISCHPRWTSDKRIVVTADLAPSIEPAAPTEFVVEQESLTPIALSEGWFHDPDAWPSVIALFVLLLAIYGAAIWAIRRGIRAYVSYPVMCVVMLPIIFIFFGQLTRLLPTNL